MMYAKQRKVPLEVSMWMDKDVRVRKATASSGLMPNDTRFNVFLSRQFYSDMFDLSYERHRTIARRDYDRKTFLKSQRRKAETVMPGLLPYIEPFKDDLEDDLSSSPSRNDQFNSPSFQSFTTRRSVNKSDSTVSSHKRSTKNTKPNRPQISLERINRLAQPKGHRTNSMTEERLRRNIRNPITAEDLFDNKFDDFSQQHSFLPTIQSKVSTDDKRFRQLIHLFADVHERQPSKIHSIQNLIQSNSSLQNTNPSWARKNSPTSPRINADDQQQILNDSMSSQTDIYLIDARA